MLLLKHRIMSQVLTVQVLEALVLEHHRTPQVLLLPIQITYLPPALVPIHQQGAERPLNAERGTFVHFRVQFWHEDPLLLHYQLCVVHLVHLHLAVGVGDAANSGLLAEVEQVEASEVPVLPQAQVDSPGSLNLDGGQ